jgi:hypothetical protein
MGAGAAMMDLGQIGLLLGIIFQTIGIGVVVFKAAHWAGHIDSALAALDGKVDDLVQRFEHLEERFNALERRGGR